ncbi:ESCRT-0 subunit protein hse1 [Steccherinum ochraceum]|uniref:Class E vacuolar protein-sorting machinery protein HSE1 n=1 Tax=Steccherinum ochraceum TaxID=92696 RepID=A0A4R0RTH7_9APHY|nr:ESCRT-0 subunit protein hse1 [Steccherinum ochraceum]
MFRGGQANPYDEIVGKATDENLTGENWELILNLCDKVQEEGEAGARNVIAAILKRLAHRNPNVQLYTLSLAESLTKNLGVEIHREISSRAFTQGLERIVTDRNTHDKVRRKATGLIVLWAHEFEKDPTLGIMEECYESLKSKGYKFDTPDEAPPPQVDDEIRRREEEELQRVLEMSVHDKGGRGQWSQYSLASGSAGTGSSASASASQPPGSSKQPPQTQAQQPTYGGYVPSANPPATADLSTTPSTVTSVTTNSYTPASPVPSHKSTQESAPVVTRVRALHTFEPSEAGELAFDKGDIIKVVDRGYKDWWRGQLKGRTGIFPVNYVEPLPEPTASEIAKEAEREAAVFNQAANVDRLLTLLRQMDPAKDNLADNEEIQELYRQCMSLRPKIVKLIDKYSQKRADLVSMNESFVKARTIFDRMMEDSLARHSAALYEGRPDYARQQSQPYGGRPDAGPDYGQQPGYGWNPSVYEQQPGYGGYTAGPPPGPGAQPGYSAEPGFAPQPYPPDAHGTPGPYGAYGPGPQPYAPGPGVAIPFGAPDPSYAQQQPHEAQGYPQALAQPQVAPTQQPPQPSQPQQPAYSVAPQQAVSPPQQEAPPQPHQQPPSQSQVQTPVQSHPPQALPVQAQTQVQPQPQPQIQGQIQPVQQQQAHQETAPQPFPAQAQPQTQAQVQVQPQPHDLSISPQPQQQAQPQVQPQTQPQAEPQSQPQSGPPYIFDPNGTYPDPNVQAWAQYYAQGGTDVTGSVYFVSVPGVKEDPSTQQAKPPSRSNTQDSHTTAQAQGQQQPAYGSSPYGAAAGPDPSWQAQYQNVANQFGAMNVGGAADGHAHGAQQGQQGVGTPA